MILPLIQQLISSGPLYVRIKADWISIRDVATSKQIEDVPLVAIHRNPKESITAIGAIAKTAVSGLPDSRLVNPFEHPRSLLADFLVAEKLLQYFIAKLSPSKVIRPSPVLIIHPLEKLEGGLTAIEVRAFQELGAGAGAREVYVWTGRELTDFEIREGSFPDQGWASDAPKWAKTRPHA